MDRILSGVVNELTGKPNRRFVWAEMSFFMRWFSSQTRDMRDAFSALVARGQIEFVGGGWVQNDEANPAPEDVIDQACTPRMHPCDHCVCAAVHTVTVSVLTSLLVCSITVCALFLVALRVCSSRPSLTRSPRVMSIYCLCSVFGPVSLGK